MGRPRGSLTDRASVPYPRRGHRRSLAGRVASALCQPYRVTTYTEESMSNTAPVNTAPAAPNPNTATYRQDDDRRRDEARIAALQSQIDELRAALRELTSRQTRGEEIAKHTEGVAAQT